MENKLLISIVMPAYNAQNYIEESIISVINQTYNKWELIIVDDGSTDMTRQIVLSYVEKNENIFYLYQNNQKQWKARNNGIEQARGELIAFLDADDLWLENKLEKSLEEFNLSKFDLLFTNAFRFSEKDDIGNLPTLKCFDIQKKEYFGYDSICEFFKGNKIPNLTVIVKTDAIKKVKGFSNFSPAEDYELWLKLLYNGYKFKAIPDKLALYREHTSSSTSSDRLVLTQVIQIINIYRKKDVRLNFSGKRELKKWIKYWVIMNYNPQRKDYCKCMLIESDLFNFIHLVLFSLDKFLSNRIFKALLWRTLTL